MNQILLTNDNYISKNKNYKNYLYLFLCSTSIFLFSLLYLINSNFIRYKALYTTNLLQNKYHINTLYSSPNINNNLKLSNNLSIIGYIEIPKIKISYPIIENTDENLLKISVCKFSGPLPNRIGNLCIAGHNYKNNTMFSNLNLLDVENSIFITDLNNSKVEYIVYDKFKVKENNLDCRQNSNNVEITLITCNDINNSERIVVKAKMKG